MKTKAPRLFKGTKLCIEGKSVTVLGELPTGVKVRYTSFLGTKAVTTIPWNHSSLEKTLPTKHELTLKDLVPGECYVLEIPDEGLSWIYRYRKGTEPYELGNLTCHSYSLNVQENWFGTEGRVINEDDGVTSTIRKATQDEENKLKIAILNELGESPLEDLNVGTIEFSQEELQNYECRYMTFPITLDSIKNPKDLESFLSEANALCLTQEGYDIKCTLDKDGEVSEVYMRDFSSTRLPLFPGDCLWVGCLVDHSSPKEIYYFTSDGGTITDWSRTTLGDSSFDLATKVVENTIESTTMHL